MKHMTIGLLLMSLFFLSPALIYTQRTDQSRRAYIGVFTPQDATIKSIKYGNWGSRPYEYWWASTIVNVTGKRVIDLGIGLPSQYNWYAYVVKNLQPLFYAGIDWDGRIKDEVMATSDFELKQMSMAALDYPDASFDIAYCISTFEHIEYETFMESIKEAHRVLTDDGLLVITLDEEWDKNEPITHGNGWNTLEQSLQSKGLFHRKKRSFGLPEFLELIKEYFVVVQGDAVVDSSTGIIASSVDGFVYYNRQNRDTAILNSGVAVNSCVSYAVLKKR